MEEILDAFELVRVRGLGFGRSSAVRVPALASEAGGGPCCGDRSCGVADEWALDRRGTGGAGGGVGGGSDGQPPLPDPESLRPPRRYVPCRLSGSLSKGRDLGLPGVPAITHFTYVSYLVSLQWSSFH